MYAHFSDVAVKRGQMVKAGQFLGHEGRTGRATGCHVHYGLFSPLETKTFAVEPAVVKRMKVPRFQTARIDPLLVLPDRNAPPVSSASPVTDQPISP
jgi:murein DD-endopeptidase MepM/ murein hydrolase activator NlpD